MAVPRGVGIEVPDPVDEEILDRGAAKIAPGPAQDVDALGLGLLGKRHGKIIETPVAILCHPHADNLGGARDPFDERAPRHKQSQPIDADGEQRHAEIAHLARGPAREISQPPVHEATRTTILPKTSRLRRRSMPRPKSSSAVSLSIVGVSPIAIFCRPSPTLRSDAPNEPMMRYCC